MWPWRLFACLRATRLLACLCCFPFGRRRYAARRLNAVTYCSEVVGSPEVHRGIVPVKMRSEPYQFPRGTVTARTVHRRSAKVAVGEDGSELHGQHRRPSRSSRPSRKSGESDSLLEEDDGNDELALDDVLTSSDTAGAADAASGKSQANS